MWQENEGNGRENEEKEKQCGGVVGSSLHRHAQSSSTACASCQLFRRKKCPHSTNLNVPWLTPLPCPLLLYPPPIFILGSLLVLVFESLLKS